MKRPSNLWIMDLAWKNSVLLLGRNESLPWYCGCYHHMHLFAVLIMRSPIFLAGYCYEEEYICSSKRLISHRNESFTSGKSIRSKNEIVIYSLLLLGYGWYPLVLWPHKLFNWHQIWYRTTHFDWRLANVCSIVGPVAPPWPFLSKSGLHALRYQFTVRYTWVASTAEICWKRLRNRPKEEAITVQTIMANLCVRCLGFEQPPFSFTVVDYFGQYYVSIRRSTEKGQLFNLPLNQGCTPGESAITRDQLMCDGHRTFHCAHCYTQFNRTNNGTNNGTSFVGAKKICLPALRTGTTWLQPSLRILV